MTAEEIMNKAGFKKHSETDDMLVYVKPGTGKVSFVKTSDGAWTVIVSADDRNVPLKYLFRVGIKTFIGCRPSVIFAGKEIWAIYCTLATLGRY